MIEKMNSETKSIRQLIFCLIEWDIFGTNCVIKSKTLIESKGNYIQVDNLRNNSKKNDLRGNFGKLSELLFTDIDLTLLI